MQWAIDNDEKARKIAERAILFIHDLSFHEDAEKDNLDNLELQQEMMQRYMTFFQEMNKEYNSSMGGAVILELLK